MRIVHNPLRHQMRDKIKADYLNKVGKIANLILTFLVWRLEKQAFRENWTSFMNYLETSSTQLGLLSLNSTRCDLDIGGTYTNCWVVKLLLWAAKDSTIWENFSVRSLNHWKSSNSWNNTKPHSLSRLNKKKMEA